MIESQATTKHLFIISSLAPWETGGPASYFNNVISEANKLTNLRITHIFFSQEIFKNKQQNFNYFGVKRQKLFIAKLYQYAVLTFLFLVKIAFCKIKKEHPIILISNINFLSIISYLFTRDIYIRYPGLVIWEREYRTNKTQKNLDEWIKEKTSIKVKILIGFERLFAKLSKKQFFPSHYLSEVFGRLKIGETHRVVYTTSKYNSHKLPNIKKVYDCVYVGRIIKHKRVTELLTTLTSDNLKVAIVGDGPLLESLKNTFFAPTATFFGKLNDDELLVVLSQARSLVSFSKYEGLPHTAVEALSLGIPVVLNDVGGNKELTKYHGVYLSPKDDVFALLKNVKKIKNDDRNNHKSIPTSQIKHEFGPNNTLRLFNEIGLLV